jgi:glycerate dehydrogenase
MSMRGVFLDAGSLVPSALDMTSLEAATISWGYYDDTPATAVAERIADADVVISNKVLLEEKALAAAKRLKLICIAATGTNNVDLDAAKRRGITVCNVRGYATPSVVEHVFTLLLALMRHLPEYHQAVQAGRWQNSVHFSFIDYPIHELHGKMMGIVGYGELGRAVGNLAGAFGMRVLIADRDGMEPRPGRMPLSELLPVVDVLTLHCPLSNETRGLIGAKELRAMKRGAMLINTARGGIVDELALLEALRSRHLGGAGVDVLIQEPPVDSPLLGTDIPNIIVTPHNAWASREARQRLVNEVAENIQAYLRGTPRNRVA